MKSLSWCHAVVAGNLNALSGQSSSRSRSGPRDALTLATHRETCNALNRNHSDKSGSRAAIVTGKQRETFAPCAHFGKAPHDTKLFPIILFFFFVWCNIAPVRHAAFRSFLNYQAHGVLRDWHSSRLEFAATEPTNLVFISCI